MSECVWLRAWVVVAWVVMALAVGCSEDEGPGAVVPGGGTNNGTGGETNNGTRAGVGENNGRVVNNGTGGETNNGVNDGTSGTSGGTNGGTGEGTNNGTGGGTNNGVGVDLWDLAIRGVGWMGHERKTVYVALEDTVVGAVVRLDSAVVMGGAFEVVWPNTFVPNYFGYLVHFYFDTNRDATCGMTDQAFTAVANNTFEPPIVVELTEDGVNRTDEACEAFAEGQ